MAMSAVEGSFSLYDGLKDFVTNQGSRPQAAMVFGDVAYGGGDSKSNEEIKQSFQDSIGKSVPVDMVFPTIGNHDVNFLGCSSLNVGKCYYGVGHETPIVTKETISFDTWRGNWLQSFPGLSGSKVLLPAAPDGNEYLAPLRFNLILSDASSIYFIAGFVSGVGSSTFGPEQPYTALPAEIKGGKQIECEFIKRSLALGKSKGKTIFVYVTHNFIDLGCDDEVNQIDVWVFGHEHYIEQNVQKKAVVKQEDLKSPVKLLIGNGGYDEGQTDVVSFGNLREVVDGDRVKVYFDVYDTCIAEGVCPQKQPAPQLPFYPWAHCWTSCMNFDGGVNGRKATKSKDNYGFMLDAPKVRAQS